MRHTSKRKTRRTIGIRGQLLWFLCFICLLLLLLFWFLSTRLLEPLYTTHIQKQLTAQADAIVERLDKAIGGETLSYWGFGSQLYVNTTFFNELGSEIFENSGMSSFCVDISDTTLRQIFKIENLSYCNLHRTKPTDTGGEMLSYSTARAMRQLCRETGSCVRKINPPTPSGSVQLMVGKTTSDGSYTVLVTTSLMHVAEAGRVMSTVLPLAAALIFAFSMSAAWLFSEWFTKPLRELSGAARQVAQGNYNVQVDSKRNDELGDLAQDFNHMAQEVQHASQMQRDLLANVSHDLRTPLTLIKGYAETVRDITGDDKAHRNEQMNIIVDEADRLTALVSSVMELSKVTSGAIQCERVHFDMGQLCDEVSERYDAVCAQNGWELKLELPGRGASRLRRPRHDAAGPAQPAGQRHAPHRGGRAFLPAGIQMPRGRPGGSGRPWPRHLGRGPALYLRPLLPLPLRRRQAGDRPRPLHHQSHFPAARFPLWCPEHRGQRHHVLVHHDGHGLFRPLKRPPVGFWANSNRAEGFFVELVTW